MIDFKNEIPKFRSVNLDNIEESVPNITDEIKNSLILYNSALENIERNSEDIAIIELKKAIALNPNFTEAMNLLGVTLNYTGEQEEAAVLFDKVIESEKNGINALIYKNSMGFPGTQTAEQIIARSEPRKSKAAKKKKPSNTDKPEKSAFARFATGFLIGAAVTGIICYPFLSNKLSLDNSTDKDTVTAKEHAELQQSYSALQSEYAVLEEAKNKAENEKLQAERERDEAKAQNGTKKTQSELIGIYGLLNETKYEEAADLLVSLNTADYSPEEQTFYNILRDRIMPTATQNAFEEGRDLCQAGGKFAEALIKLEKVSSYDSNYKRDGVLYYSAKSHQGLGDFEKAKALYNEILQQFPNGFYIEWIPLRLNEIARAESAATP